jgi:hypothetical protein
MFEGKPNHLPLCKLFLLLQLSEHLKRMLTSHQIITSKLLSKTLRRSFYAPSLFTQSISFPLKIPTQTFLSLVQATFEDMGISVKVPRDELTAIDLACRLLIVGAKLCLIYF